MTSEERLPSQPSRRGGRDLPDFFFPNFNERALRTESEFYRRHFVVLEINEPISQPNKVNTSPSAVPGKSSNSLGEAGGGNGSFSRA